jgi:hypothetical protein
MEFAKIKKGDFVTIHPAHRDLGDENFRWQATDDEEKGRVTITPHGVLSHLKATQVVQRHMIILEAR